MLWQNEPLVAALAAMLAAQLLKLLVHLVKTGRFDHERLWNTGGMPSSHTAMATALAAAFALQGGMQSPAFAVATVLALIIMYDAAGIRHQAGKQATVINRLVKELQHLDATLPKDIDETELKELLGHRPMEVFGGGLLGVGTAVVVTGAGAPSHLAAVVISSAAAVLLVLGALRRLLGGHPPDDGKEDLPPNRM